MDEIIPENLQGLVVDDFEILEEVGRGASSRVHLAKHIPTGCYVAAKIINLKAQTKFAFEGITREISVFMQVSHPNIAKLFRLSKYGDYLIFFMEYAANGTLYNYVMSKRGLSEEECYRIFCQLFSVVYFIQSMHFLVHRDIKLENILLDAQNNVKVIDFGLSDTYYRNVLRNAVGTPGYTAPEILTGNEYNEKCDVWSLGVTLYAALTSQMPFSVQHKDARKLYNEACNLPKLSGISPELQDLLSQMLQPRAQNRPTIFQIISHPWLKKGVKPLRNIATRTIVFYDVPNFNDVLKFKRRPEKPDPAILQKCVSLGFTSQQVQEGLERGDIDNVTTTYFLLSRPCLEKPEPVQTKLPRLTSQQNKKQVKKRKCSLPTYNTQFRNIGMKRPVLGKSVLACRPLHT